MLLWQKMAFLLLIVIHVSQGMTLTFYCQVIKVLLLFWNLNDFVPYSQGE
jgi:hypothetical protein